MTEYRLLFSDGIETTTFRGRKILLISSLALRRLAEEAFTDVNYFLRGSLLEAWASILKGGTLSHEDPIPLSEDAPSSSSGTRIPFRNPEETPSANDRFVIATLLKNAAIAAQGVFPLCQDTGTATILGWKGENVWVEGNEQAALEEGVRDAYTRHPFRASQIAPLGLFEEIPTDDNLPAQIDLYAVPGSEYRFLFLAKGGGSSNKTMLYQETPAILEPRRLKKFLQEKISQLGVAACPPYRLAIAIGGTSPEANLKMVKLASSGFLDDLPCQGCREGKPFRDLEWEERVLALARQTGWGAQFGGRYLALEARVIRLSRHAASCPIGIGVSCSADRQILGKITEEGVFLEALDRNPARFLDLIARVDLGEAIPLDLDRPLEEVRQEIHRYPVGTRFHLSGTVIVARDRAHLRMQAMLDAGEDLPPYMKNHPVFYAGPAATPPGRVTGSLGPTTAGRMDSYVESFMARGGSLIMIAKGNRSPAVTQACQRYGGFYLGAIGGAAAIVAEEHVVQSLVIDMADLGMEAVRRLVVKDLPAFLLIDDRGQTFYRTP